MEFAEVKLSQVILILAVIALVVIFISRRLRTSSGVPDGQIFYADNEVLQKLPKPLYDEGTGLVGKPDYILRKGDGSLIPLEFKSGRAPSSPYLAHVRQLAAYCLLVETTYQSRPPYGILRYADKDFKLPYTAELEGELRGMIAEMQSCEAEGCRPDRSHESTARCKGCGFQNVCDQTLTDAL